MRLFILLTCAAFAAGCGDPTGVPERTLYIEFNHAPTADDRRAVTGAGADVTHMFEAVPGILARTTAPVERYNAIQGVTKVMDLGSDEDPIVSVFITVKDSITNEDLEFVRERGQTENVTTSRFYPVIFATMRISRVDALSPNPRFVKIEVAKNDLTLQ